MMDQLVGDDAKYHSSMLDFLQRNTIIEEPVVKKKTKTKK